MTCNGQHAAEARAPARTSQLTNETGALYAGEGGGSCRSGEGVWSGYGQLASKAGALSRTSQLTGCGTGALLVFKVVGAV